MAKQFLDLEGLKTFYNKINLKYATNDTVNSFMGQKGAKNGLATLDSSGKVPTSQLPSYVDDVLEYAQKSSFPATGESGKIYISQNDNKTYRWSGSAYVEISASLALGETSSTAFPGNRGKALEENLSDLESQFSDLDEYAKEYLLDKITAVEDKNTEQDTAINEKADKNHTHTIANVTGLQSELDGKVDKSVTASGEMGVSGIVNSGSSMEFSVKNNSSDTDATRLYLTKMQVTLDVSGVQALSAMAKSGVVTLNGPGGNILDESMAIPTSQITALFN